MERDRKEYCSSGTQDGTLKVLFTLFVLSLLAYVFYLAGQFYRHEVGWLHKFLTTLEEFPKRAQEKQNARRKEKQMEEQRRLKLESEDSD